MKFPLILLTSCIVVLKDLILFSINFIKRSANQILSLFTTFFNITKHQLFSVCEFNANESIGQAVPEDHSPQLTEQTQCKKQQQETFLILGSFPTAGVGKVFWPEC